MTPRYNAASGIIAGELLNTSKIDSVVPNVHRPSSDAVSLIILEPKSSSVHWIEDEQQSPASLYLLSPNVHSVQYSSYEPPKFRFNSLIYYVIYIYIYIYIHIHIYIYY
jgi:hypothetical protein